MATSSAGEISHFEAFYQSLKDRNLLWDARDRAIESEFSSTEQRERFYDWFMALAEAAHNRRDHTQADRFTIVNTLVTTNYSDADSIDKLQDFLDDNSTSPLEIGRCLNRTFLLVPNSRQLETRPLRSGDVRIWNDRRQTLAESVLGLEPHWLYRQPANLTDDSALSCGTPSSVSTASSLPFLSTGSGESSLSQDLFASSHSNIERRASLRIFQQIGQIIYRCDTPDLSMEQDETGDVSQFVLVLNLEDFSLWLILDCWQENEDGDLCDVATNDLSHGDLGGSERPFTIARLADSVEVLNGNADTELTIGEFAHYTPSLVKSHRLMTIGYHVKFKRLLHNIHPKMPYLDLDHGRVFYTDTHPTDESPRSTFIFHHGLGSTHCFYQSIIPALTSPPNNFRCITYDTISSGLSSIATEPQSVPSLSKDVIDILGALKVEKAVLVGHSMGGVVVPHLASTRKDKFVAAILIGPVLPTPDNAKTFGARIQAVEKGGMEAMADTVPTAATGSKSTSLQHALIRTLLLSQNPRGYISMCKVIASASPPDYAAIAIPTLLIAGREDKSAPLTGCEEILKRVGCKEKDLAILEGVGHWLCIEAPEQVVEQIVHFCDSFVASSRAST